ncbi:MAG: hypothetical protein K0S20_581 [Patescibacteria group bacterium]|nr:hypothetical protein [Patescibacteria group bacterium]
MDHVAIMKKSWGMIGKVADGSKTIESRWYKHKARPWNCIKAGETVYFKNSGEPLTLKAIVQEVLQFENLTPEKVREIVEEYGDDIKLPSGLHHSFEDKNYCMLIFLKDPLWVEPFSIDKTGFGSMSAWVSVHDIESIRVRK